MAVSQVDGLKVLKMRNPWGKAVWHSSEGRIKRLNDELSQSGRKQDSGMFYMPSDELKANFDEISICHYWDAYHYSQKRQRYQDSRQLYVFQIELSSSGLYYFTVSKPDKRYKWTPNTDTFISLVVLRPCSQEEEYLGGVHGIHRDPFFQSFASAGKYIAFVKPSEIGSFQYRFRRLPERTDGVLSECVWA